ncbi:hypothetical protein ZWY2020_024992 [Hordeum vulgare]|nr:hypothetical protein ZWY2020_024992 [Hordeum vulgare]
MGKKGKRRGVAAATGAPEEAAQREAPAAASDPDTLRRSRRRGGDARAAQEASATLHALDPAVEGKGATDREKNPKLNKRKKNKRKQSPCAAASGADAAATGKSGDDCTDGEGVLGDSEVSKKRKRNKKIMQDPSSSAVSDDNAIVEANKSGIGCKNVEDVPGDDEASRRPRNEEDLGFSAVNNEEQYVPKGKKPKRRKRNKNKHEPSFPAVVDAAVVVGKSENDSTGGKGVPGVAEISTSPRNGEGQDCPEVNIVEETLVRNKPEPGKWEKIKQGRSPAAVSDDGAVEAEKSGNVCTDGDDALGDAQVNMSTLEVPYRPEVNMAKKVTREKKKRKPKKRKNNKQGPPSVVLDTGAVVAAESGNRCMSGDGARQHGEDSISPRIGEDPNRPGVNIGEKGVPQMKKNKLNKWKKKNQEQSPSTLLDAGDVVPDKSGRGSTNVEAASRGADVTMSPRNGEGQNCPAVNIVEKETLERKKPEPRKWKKNKPGQSPAAVSDDGAVEAEKSGNVCTDGDDALGDAQVSMSTVEDPYCPEVNMAKKGTREKKKRKPKKRKNKKEGSPSVVLDTGAVVAAESGNSFMNGDGAPQDGEASISPKNGEDPNRPGVNIAEKGVPQMKKNKLNKWKRKNQEQPPSTLLDACDVVPDKSGRGSTNVEAPSRGADVTTSPSPGEGPKYPNVNITEHLVEENKVNKDYSQEPKLKKQKYEQDQSPSAIPDTGAIVIDKIEKGYIEGEGGEGLPGDTEINMSPRNGKGPDCPEVNIAENSVEGKNGNNDNSQKPKQKKRRRKKRAQVAVTEAPAVGDVSSDERKDVCRTGTVKVTGSMGYSICESEVTAKNVVQDKYSPGGSLVRFQRKKLLILDLNGLLADITPVHSNSPDCRLAHAKVRGKYVFIRPYYDDFLRFCFQNFELGVWSSRMKVNVDAVVDILMKDLRQHLLFCWDLSHCTTTKCNTLENRYKPLVLKELKKLWNKEDPDLPWEQGEFSPSNTLLVDDSPYKALCNPPHTAIFPQPYSYHNRRDNSLGPGGDIRVYLENLAAADDVQHYVQEHPFGQSFITESDPNWDFYAKIRDRMDKRKEYAT